MGSYLRSRARQRRSSYGTALSHFESFGDLSGSWKSSLMTSIWELQTSDFIVELHRPGLGACSLSCSFVSFFGCPLPLYFLLGYYGGCSFRMRHAPPETLYQTRLRRTRAHAQKETRQNPSGWWWRGQMENTVNVYVFCCSRLPQCTKATLFT